MLLARLPFPPCVPSTNRRGDPDSGLGAIFARGSPSHRSQGSTHVDPTGGIGSSVFRSISFRRQLSVRICPPRYRPIDVHSYSIMCLGPDHVADAVQAAAVTDDLLKADVYFLTIRTVSSLARTVIQWANRAASAASDTRSFTCTIRLGGCGRTLWASQRKVYGCVLRGVVLGSAGSSMVQGLPMCSEKSILGFVALFSVLGNTTHVPPVSGPRCGLDPDVTNPRSSRQCLFPTLSFGSLS